MPDLILIKNTANYRWLLYIDCSNRVPISKELLRDQAMFGVARFEKKVISSGPVEELEVVCARLAKQLNPDLMYYTDSTVDTGHSTQTKDLEICAHKRHLSQATKEKISATKTGKTNEKIRKHTKEERLAIATEYKIESKKTAQKLAEYYGISKKTLFVYVREFFKN